MENSKYYAPTIEEFHVGFEYEIKVLLKKGKCEWLPFTLKHPNYEWMNVHINGDDRTYSVPECVRVKYLDREDIESLGWKLVEDFTDIDSGLNKLTFEQDSKIYFNQKLRLKYTVQTSSLWIFMLGDMYFHYNDFRGTIKNKSELKKLMQQLNII